MSSRVAFLNSEFRILLSAFADYSYSYSYYSVFFTERNSSHVSRGAMYSHSETPQLSYQYKVWKLDYFNIRKQHGRTVHAFYYNPALSVWREENVTRLQKLDPGF